MQKRRYFDPDYYKKLLSPFGCRVFDTFIQLDARNKTRPKCPDKNLQKSKLTLQFNPSENLSVSNISCNHYNIPSTSRSKMSSGNIIAKDFFTFDQELHFDSIIDNAMPIMNFLEESKDSFSQQQKPKGKSDLIGFQSNHAKQEVNNQSSFKPKPNNADISWTNMFDSELIFDPLENLSIGNKSNVANESLQPPIEMVPDKNEEMFEFSTLNKNMDVKKINSSNLAKKPEKNKVKKLAKKTERKYTTTNNELLKTVTQGKPRICTSKIAKKVEAWLDYVHKDQENQANDSKCAKFKNYVDIKTQKTEKQTKKCQKTKKSIQTCLANKGGVMKYSCENSEKLIKNDNLDHKTARNTNNMITFPPNISTAVLNMTTNFDDNFEKTVAYEMGGDVKHEESITNQKQYTNKTNYVNEIQKPLYKLDNTVPEDKQMPDSKKKKPKFIVPIKSQIPIKDIQYDILELDKMKIEKFEGAADSLTLVLVYTNDFCQLNKQYTEDDCAVEGLMILINESKFYYVLTETILNKDSNHLRNTLKKLLAQANLVCFDGKEIFIYLSRYDPTLINTLDGKNFFDLKIAGFLLDPDKPPQTFSELQNALSFTPDYTIATESKLQKTAWYTTLLRDCMFQIQEKMNDNDLMNIFLNLEMQLLPIVAGMEHRGLKIDLGILNNIGSSILDQIRITEQDCYKAAGKKFQINSPLQVRSILYDDLKLDSKMNVKIRETLSIGAKSTSEVVLKSLAGCHPLPNLIIEYRHLHKAHATFVTGITQHVKNSVVRSSWSQTAAATGRISSNNPNLQAIPKTTLDIITCRKMTTDSAPNQVLNFRSAFLSREGYTFVAADFQHIECRVFAHLSADPNLIEIFKNDGDLFKALAQKWLNKSEVEVTLEDRERTKRIVYASLYGAGTKKLMDILDTTYEQTLAIVSSFNRIFPSLKAFGQKVIKVCEQEDGVLRTICGRKRKFDNIFNANYVLKSQAERQAINFTVQGSAADLCKLAMIDVKARLDSMSPPVDHFLVLQIHDELIWEIRDEDVERATDAIQQAMENCGFKCGMHIKLPVVILKGKTWAEITK